MPGRAVVQTSSCCDRRDDRSWGEHPSVDLRSTPMKRTTRLAAALVATAALTAPATSAVAQAASAPAVKGQAKQLLKDIAGKDARLARLSTSDAVTRLADDTEAELVANIGDAR